MGRPHKLADEIADVLLNGDGQEFDPDAADDFGQGPVLEDSDDEQLRQQQRSLLTRRIQAAIDLNDLGSAYKGRRVSRAEAFPEDNQAKDAVNGAVEQFSDLSDDWATSNTENATDSDSAQLHAAYATMAAQDAQVEDRWTEKQLQAGSGDMRRTDVLSKEQDVPLDDQVLPVGNRPQTRSPEGAVPAAVGEHALDNALDVAYAAMEAQDTAAVSAFADRAAKERQKGKAVSAQRVLWNKALELRVSLQRAVPAANRLPLPSDVAICATLSSDVGDALKDLRRVAGHVLGDLVSLHDVLMEQQPAAQEAAQAAGTTQPEPIQDGNAPTTLEDLWTLVNGRCEYFAPYRDASLDRWHRKVLLQNTAALKSGGLRALNQSLSQQVSTLMDAPQQLLKRVRMQSAAVKRICLDDTIDTTPDQTRPSEQLQRNAAQVVAQGSTHHEDLGHAEEGAVDEETFDDAEFYGGLLKDFLEAQGDAAGAMAAAMQQRTRKRKQVDRKASKGRKIRYHVHEKLVGFTAPVPLNATSMTANLFANLFGGQPAPVLQQAGGAVM